MSPKHHPIFSLGAVDVMMAKQAGHSPAEKPWKLRMAKSSHGVCTKPPQTYEMAKQAAARTAIALWLFLSESAPQIGAMMALIKNEIEKIRPDQILTSLCATPNSSIKYIGRKGTSIV